jgi:hypothetical protein
MIPYVDPSGIFGLTIADSVGHEVLVRSIPHAAAVVAVEGSPVSCVWAWGRAESFGSFDAMREGLPVALLEGADAVKIAVVGHSLASGKVEAFSLSSPSFAAAPLDLIGFPWGLRTK